MPAYIHQWKAIMVQPEQQWHSKALQELAGTLIQAQKWNEAEHIVYSIKDEKEQANLLQKLAIKLANVGKLQQARTVIFNIKVNHEQNKALIALGEAFAQSGYLEDARRVWQKVQNTIPAIETSDSGKRTEILWELAKVLVKTKQWQQAEKVINSIQQGHEKASALCELGQGLAQAQQKEQALRVWQQAEKVISSLKQWSEERDRALRELGQALIHAQEWQQAEKVISSIQQGHEKASALCELGQGLAQAQQKEQALRVWQQAEKVISSLGKSEQARALCELGQTLAQAQLSEQALRIWQQAEKVISSIQWSEWDEELAENRKRKQNLIQALVLAQKWQHAEAVIGSIKSISVRSEALHKLGEALKNIKDDELLLRLVQRWWLQASTRDEALSLLSLANGLVHLQPEISIRFYEAFAWVDTFLEN